MQIGWLKKKLKIVINLVKSGRLENIMKKNIILLSIALMLLITTGCEKKEKRKETFRTFEYYMAHTEEMLARVKECEAINYIKSRAKKEDCRAAGGAKNVYHIRHNK